MYGGTMGPWRGVVRSGMLGDPMPDFSDVVSGSGTVSSGTLLQRLHAVAVAMAAARQRGDVEAVASLQPQFNALADAIRAQGDTDMTAIDRAVLAVGNYVEGVVDALPSALAALPTAAGKALGLSLSAFIVPALLVGGALWLASKTPGVRRML